MREAATRAQFAQAGQSLFGNLPMRVIQRPVQSSDRRWRGKPAERDCRFTPHLPIFIEQGTKQIRIGRRFLKKTDRTHGDLAHLGIRIVQGLAQNRQGFAPAQVRERDDGLAADVSEGVACRIASRPLHKAPARSFRRAC